MQQSSYFLTVLFKAGIPENLVVHSSSSITTACTISGYAW